MVKFSDDSVTTIETDLLAVPVDSELASDALTALSEASNVDLAAAARDEHFKGDAGATMLFRGLANVTARRVLLVGVGTGELKRAGAAVARVGRTVHAPRVAFSAGQRSSEDVGDFVQGFGLGAYRFDRHLSRDEDAFGGFETLAICGSKGAEAAVAQATAVCDGIILARDLSNESPNLLYPETLAQAALDVATQYGFEHRLFDENELTKHGFNLIMAVGKGSEHPPRMVHLTYRGAGTPTRKIALVGKGVTFDTGGYNLKPGTSMLNMHCDMAGAAAVIGAAKAIGELRPEGVEIHFIVPSAENNIANNAYKPQDIFRGYGGKTVEIHNTDAEGRLLLADALAYAGELGVDTIIDLATLTGACVVALGEHTAGLFTNDDALATALLDASGRASEHVWRMPLTAKLDSLLDTPHADMKNVGSRWGGAITAGLFLKRWVNTDSWAHLDIAGPAFSDKEGDVSSEGGTGFGVATLVEFIRGAAKA